MRQNLFLLKKKCDVKEDLLQEETAVMGVLQEVGGPGLTPHTTRTKRDLEPRSRVGVSEWKITKRKHKG